MASAGPQNGTTFLFYSAGTAVGLSTNFTMNFNMAMIDVTSKGDAGWTNNLPGLRDVTADVEGIVAFDNATNAEYLYGLLSAQTKVKCKASNATSGDGYWHGDAYITSLSISAPMEDKMTFSASFAGDGVWTLSQKT